MKFEEAQDYIWNRPKLSKTLGLHRVQYILNYFSNPQNKLKIIHVAGTNGKGSVSTYISNVLLELGYSVGVYTSPHLVKVNERILCNGFQIEDREICQYAEQVMLAEKDLIRELGEGLSEFEVLTTIAFLYYSSKNIEFVILEVGLGGRFDATNVCHPILSIISAIGLDHEQLLGDTLEKIAFEKAGIIKKGVPVVVGRQVKDSIKKIILEKALECSADTYFVEDFHLLDMNLKEMNVIVKTPFSGKYKIVRSEMIGLHQVENIAIAFTAIEYLTNTGYIDECDELVLYGLKKAFIRGRMEMIETNPPVILDGAHNKMGLLKLKDSIIWLLDNKIITEFIFVVGMMKDKLVREEVKELSKLAKYTIFVPLEMQRAMSKELLREEYEEEGSSIYFSNSVEEGIATAKELSSKSNTAIFVAGSLYLVGNIIDCYTKYSDKK